MLDYYFQGVIKVTRCDIETEQENYKRNINNLLFAFLDLNKTWFQHVLGHFQLQQNN